MNTKIWFWENIVDHIHEGVLVTDPNANILYMNPALEKIMGYTLEEVKGKHPSIFNADGILEEMQKDIMNNLSENKCKKFVCRNKKKDGSVFLKQFTISPIFDDNSNLCGYLSLESDITESKKIEDDLKISTQKYRSIFENAPLYINLVNKDGILIDSNDRSKDLLGYTREEMVGKHFSFFLHPDYLDQAYNLMNEFIHGKQQNQVTQEYKMIRKDKSIILVEARTSFLPDVEGVFLHTICFITDVTDRQKKETELQTLADSLKKSNEALEQFAYLASHDLQEPLRVVSSYCQILKETCGKCKNATSERDKYFNYVLEATLRMKNLICDLLDFSRAGREEKPLEKVNLFQMVNEVLSDLEVSITEANADVFVDENLPDVFVIPFRFKQVFTNLIGNSLKFRSDRKPIIEVGFKDRIDKWEFYVKDNGIGIDPKYFNRIFGIFKRLYPKDKYPGSGIGLAICKKIIENHDGKIWVESEPDKGTCMFFTTPKIKKNGNKKSSKK